jgi:hypothetical protein
MLGWPAACAVAATLFGMVASYPLPTPYAGNVINVKQHGAKGDGVSDDTAAIRSSIIAARDLVKDPASPYPAPHYGVRVLYFPEGEYLVSDTLQLYENVTIYPNGTVEPAWFFRISLELVVMGDGVGATTVRLAPRSAGFSDPDAPRAMFLTFPASHHNDGQWLSYQDLALRISEGNHGAVALDHIANNVNGVANVAITSDDKGGYIGVTFSRDLGGQAYFKNLTVTGFKTGIALGGSMMTVALDGVTVSDAEVGVNVTDKIAQIRGLVTTPTVGLPVSLHGTASLVLIDSALELSLSARGDDKVHIAIDNRNGTQLYARNVSVSEGAIAVAEPAQSNDVAGPHVAEYSQSAPVSAFADAPTSSPFLRTEIPLTPPEGYVAADEWTVFDTSVCGVHNGTEILQQVVDSGVENLMLRNPYPLPAGLSEHDIGCGVDQLVLRGNIRRFHGGWFGVANADYKNRAHGRMGLRVDTMTHGLPVTIEALAAIPGIQQNSTHPLILRQVMCNHPRGTCLSNTWGVQTGPIFTEAFQGSSGTVGGNNISHFGEGPCVQLNPGGSLWALALDFEGTQRHLRNDGGSLFSLGNKMGEIQGRPTLYAAGGKTELLGGVFNGGMDTGYPTVVVNASVVSMVGWTNRFAKSAAGANLSDPGQQIFLETQHGITHGLNQEAFPVRIARFHSPSMVNRSEVGNHIPFYRSALKIPGPNPPQPAPPPPPPPPDLGQYACNTTSKRCEVVSSGGQPRSECLKAVDCAPPPPPSPKRWYCNSTFGQCEKRVQSANDTDCHTTCKPVLTPECEKGFEHACPGLRGKLRQCEDCQKTTAAQKLLRKVCPLMQGKLLSRIFLLYCNASVAEANIEA